MSLTHLYILDLDGTLFKSDALWDNFRELCANKWGVSKERFDETYSSSRMDAGAYDIDKHLESLDLSPETVRSEIELLMKSKNYVFEDVIPFFDAHKDAACMILTQGVSWFQSLKANVVPISKNVCPVTTTLEKKNGYILSHMQVADTHIIFDGVPYASITFVDNMANAFILPEDSNPFLRQYRIRRNVVDDRHAEIMTLTGIPEVTTLLNIP